MVGMRIAVCGLHLRGQPLNHQLTDLSAVFVKEAKTAPLYRLYMFEESGKKKPCLVQHFKDPHCRSIDIEIWEMPIENVGNFLNLVPAPLGIGTIRLDDDSTVKGFIAEAWVAESSKLGEVNTVEITKYGSWLEFLKSQ